MRVWSLVMMLLVLGLSAMPCCTDDTCIEEVDTTSGDHSEDNCGSCSPFLACGSCSGFVFQTHTIVFQPSLVAMPGNSTPHTPCRVEPGSAEIWQPPRIG